MIRNYNLGKPVRSIFGLNIILIFIAFLYGLLGGSGGGTTEGVFLTISFAGLLSIVLLVILSFVNLKYLLKEWYFVLVLIIVSIFELKLIV